MFKRKERKGVVLGKLVQIKFNFLVIILMTTLLYAEDKETPSWAFDGRDTSTPQVKIVPEPTPTPQVKPNPEVQKYILKLNIIPKNADVIFLKPKISYTYGMRLNKRTYKILVKRSGYESKNITIKLNKNMSQKIKLKKIKKMYTLKIKPNISGTNISFVNIKKKYKPNILLEGGKKYTIKVTKPGYKTKLFYTTLRKNETIKVKLEKNPPKYCSLEVRPNISGTNIKITNILKKYKRKVQLPCGKKYNIQVSKKRYITRKFTTILRHSEVILVDLRRK